MTALLDDLTATTRDALDAVLNRVDPAHFWRCAIGVAGVASAAAASFTPRHEPTQTTPRITFLAIGCISLGSIGR